MKKLLILSLCIVVSCLQAAVAQPKFDGENRLQLYQKSDILEVALDSLEINDILTNPENFEFIPTSDITPDTKSVKYEYWIKYRFIAKSELEPQILIPFHGTAVIDFYQTHKDSILSFHRAGTDVKLSEKNYKNVGTIFNVDTSLGDQIEGYIRIKGNALPLLTFYVTDKDEIIDSSANTQVLYGAIIGLILLIFIYNVVFYFQIRDKDNLYYAIWVLLALFTFFNFQGYAQLYLWPENTVLNDYVDLLIAATNVFFVLFGIAFLKLKEQSRVLFKVGVGIAITSVITGIALNLTPWPYHSVWNLGTVSLFQSLWCLVAGVVVLRKGFKPALFYLTANLVYVACVFVMVGYVNGTSEYSFWTYNSMHIGLAAQIILFSAALSYKVNLFKRGKEEAEKEQLSLLQENRDIITRQKEELEVQVEDRTKELKKAKERAEESEAFKQQFLANMSHEIRTPMNAVMGMTNLVLDTPLENKQKDYLTKVKKSSDNLLHIINDILDLSKIEAGKMELEDIDFSLSDAVGQVKNTLQHKAEEKGLELLTRIDSNIKDIVLGDPVRLNQVLINLAGNAIKFTEKGSVAIDLKKEGDKIRLSIIDTGIGIPEDKIKTVFENFGQANTSDTRKYGGTGLGLSISQQLVNLMGGSIDIESEVGKGTTFYFDIDLKEGNKERYEERMAGEENVDGSILNDLTILVADDNEYNRIVARDTLLSKAKVKIIEAENGQEVLDKLTDNINVILMDAQMPVMSGFEATKKIREQGNNVPIIALTASVLRTDLDRCQDAGMNGYIPKPFKAHELIVGIADALNITLKLDKTASNGQITSTSNGISDNVTNLDYLRDFCAGDESKMQKYIDMFLKSAPKFITDLESLIENNDAEGIANHVHGFNTKLTMMGMKESKSRSINIENALRDSGTPEQVSDAMEALLQDVKNGMDELS